MRIAALGRGTQDIIAIDENNAVEAELHRRGLKCEGVQFFQDRSLILDVIQDVQRLANTTWAGGGTISNTLFALATCFEEVDVDSPELYWLGSAEYSDFPGQVNPMDYLRRVFITPICVPSLDGSRVAISVISAQTKEVKAIFLYDNPEPLSAMSEWPPVDVLITSIAELARADAKLFEYISSIPSLAIVVADCHVIDEETQERLRRLALSGALKWMMGYFDDFIRLKFLMNEEPLPEYRSVEFVGTDGAKPVHIWRAESNLWQKSPVHPIHEFHGNTLGAGDAYAGAFLAVRIRGGDIEQAHKFGYQLAARTFETHLSHVDIQPDFNRIFGRLIDRASLDHREGALYERIRQSPGITVISCGQTGVDQIALRSASKLGLPCFGVLPKGRRTEFTEGLVSLHDDFSDACIFELDSPSYRYCTWSNAYLSDGTLLWDFHNSEGSAATREACGRMRRPLLDVTKIRPDRLATEVVEWATRHNVRVVNFAGNRQRLLSDANRKQVEKQTDYILRCLAWNWSYLSAGIATPLHRLEENMHLQAPYAGLRVGVSKDSLIQGMMRQFLWDVYGIVPGSQRKLFLDMSDLGLTLIFARARDLPTMLQNSLVDLIVCGSDLLDEAAVDCSIIVRTGTHPCHIVLVGEQSLDPLSTDLAKIRIGSQYPKLADRLMRQTGYHNTTIVPILGAAEAWIKTGYLDAAIDTWRTGYTASINELRLLKTFFSTALVVATAADTATSLVAPFKDAFEQWLVTYTSAEQ